MNQHQRNPPAYYQVGVDGTYDRPPCKYCGAGSCTTVDLAFAGGLNTPLCAEHAMQFLQTDGFREPVPEVDVEFNSRDSERGVF